MKIVQSFWSNNQSDILNKTFAWRTPEYHLMGWALSCLQLKKYYNKVELYTDKAGYELLIEKLKLPYTKVHVELDVLNKYHPDLWAISKIYTYAKQETPFLHVDGDVFVWEKFNDELLQSPLIAQNQEQGTKYHYEPQLRRLEKIFSFYPKELSNHRKTKVPIMAYNAGILGGNDIAFFKEYTEKAFEFVDKNKRRIPKMRGTFFNVFFEQYLFYCLSIVQNKKVGVLIDDIIMDNGYRNLDNFSDVPYDKKYLHLVGQTKRTEKTCIAMSRMLRQEYPDFYYRILDLFPEKHKKITTIAKEFSGNHLDLMHQYKSKNIEKYTNETDKTNGISIAYSYKRTNFVSSKFIKYPLINKFAKVPLFQKFIKYSLINKNVKEISKDSLVIKVKTINNERLHDVFQYENAIIQLKKDFSSYNPQYLYARDLISNTYYEKIFGQILEQNKEKLTLQKDNLIKITSSKWDWITTEEKRDFFNKVATNFKQPSKAYKTIIIPEINDYGHTECELDELNEVILHILETPKTIAVFFSELKTYFDAEDLSNSYSDFYMLIRGRLKELIYYKCIIVN